MPVSLEQDRRVWQRYDRATVLKRWAWWIVSTMVVIGCWQIISGATRWEFVADAPQQLAQLANRAFPPRWDYMSQLWKPLWDTVNIATLGTLVGLIIAFPVAFLAARNTTPHPVIRIIALLIIVVSRSVNSLIWALILVALIGPGVLAGIIAIGLRSIGFIGKLFYEAIEETSIEPIEAITATGASRFQVLTYAYLPQVLPTFTGVTVFRWDINIRESTVLGLVGAGGLGIALNASINALQWDRAGMIFVVIFVMVLISEWISARVRKAII
ncbi:MAG: phosphonate ABC transporter, permease protein PhnE [Chloroflexia bacterium]|nr:phosphonate ABC transporter, permease protein PhnE [Chloroflexia bacterium]